MTKIMLSLNFMHCMERFATQIYRTQKSAFDDDSIKRQIVKAAENEREHVTRLRTQIKALNGNIYPFGFLFQSVGFLLGLLTRMSGKLNLFKADRFVENRAVKDYNSFLKSVSFNADTVKIIRGIIADEEVHIHNWNKAIESFS